MEKDEIEQYKQAGQITKQAREFARDFVKRDMKLFDIAEAIENKIRELGAEPAFPVNLSLNEVAAHYTPRPGDETLAQGILKIDIGACMDGYIGDTAISLDLTEDQKFKEIIELNKALLKAAKEAVSPELEVKDIGDVITNKLTEYNTKKETNFTIIAGLTGHGLDKDLIHTSPNIPNYANSNSKKLKGMAFAVEPFVTTGSGEIYEGDGGGIYSIKNPSGQARDRDARQILKYVNENFKTRPFCARWLERAGFNKINFALSILTKQGIIHHYPQLIERTKSPVSQMEHSFLITDDEAICLTE
jgi:methionyl aminopeptidase